MNMDITVATINELAMLFPSGTFYREQVEQGFQEPSFYVHQVSAKTDSLLATRQLNKQMLSITYFPDTDAGNLNRQLQEVAETLTNEFRFIHDLKLHVFDKDIHIENNVIVFTFYVKYTVREEVFVDNAMTLISAKGELK